MSIEKIVNIDTVQSSTPLPQVYSIAMRTDEAAKTIGNIKDSVFARVRREAAKVYERHLGLAKGDVNLLDGKSMRAEFKHTLDQAESEYAGAAPDKKAKNTWNKNKTDLGRALLLCYDFVEAGQAGSSAIVKWCGEEEDRIEEEVNADARKKQAEKEGKPPMEVHTNESKTVDVVGGDGGKEQAGAAGDKAVASGTGIVFASPDQEARFNKLITLMKGISEIDPAELNGMIDGAITQLDAKTNKLLRKFAQTG